jgi:hypothetical protein
MARQSLKELVASSGLAFVGTVQAVGESTVQGVPVDDRTVVARVDRALRAPPAVEIAPAGQVTVQLSGDLPKLKVGDQATFFANPAVYGEGLMVSEVGRMSEEPEPAAGARFANLEEPTSGVDEALAELAQDAVLEHAREAEVIVRARVVRLEEAKAPELPREHDPHWWIATLEADLLAKGDAPGLGEGGGTVTALYANSIDRQWREWIKPKAGQGGLWLLHRSEDDLAQLAPFQLIHQEDLQPSAQLDALREAGIGDK